MSSHFLDGAGNGGEEEHDEEELVQEERGEEERGKEGLWPPHQPEVMS